jgi:hypothetical protein
MQHGHEYYNTQAVTSNQGSSPGWITRLVINCAASSKDIPNRFACANLLNSKSYLPHTWRMAPEEFLIPHQNPKWENSANRKPRARAQEERILSVMRYVKILNVCICFSAFMIMMSTMAFICNENHSEDSKPHWCYKWGSCSSNVRTRPHIPKKNWCHQSRAQLNCHDFGLQSATHQ